MNQNPDNLNVFSDPKEYCDDIDQDFLFYENLLIYLLKLEEKRPHKNYAALFYERYIMEYSLETSQKIHNITLIELNSRLLDIINYITRQAA